MAELLNLGGEVLQWLACLFVVALYLDCRGLRRRIDRLEAPEPKRRDWSKVDTTGMVSGAQPPQTGLIPGRKGQEINSGPHTWIPPMRPDTPARPEDR